MKYYYIDTTFSALLSEHTSSGCEYIEAAWKQDNTSSFHGSGSVWLYIYWAADTLTQSFCFQDFWIISRAPYVNMFLKGTESTRILWMV